MVAMDAPDGQALTTGQACQWSSPQIPKILGSFYLLKWWGESRYSSEYYGIINTLKIERTRDFRYLRA